MTQSATRRITEALQSRDTPNRDARSAERMVISRDDLEAAVSRGVAEGLQEHQRRMRKERESRSDRSNSSSSPIVRLLTSIILIAAAAYMRQKLKSGSGRQSGEASRHQSTNR